MDLRASLEVSFIDLLEFDQMTANAFEKDNSLLREALVQAAAGLGNRQFNEMCPFLPVLTRSRRSSFSTSQVTRSSEESGETVWYRRGTTSCPPNERSGSRACGLAVCSFHLRFGDRVLCNSSKTSSLLCKGQACGYHSRQRFLVGKPVFMTGRRWRRGSAPTRFKTLRFH